MRLLMIGGTVFLGRHIVEAALARGHELTLFHRGQRGADLFPDVERVLGNRDGEIGKLAGRQWDAVIDTCGYFPRIVRQSAEGLRDQVGHYTFISSISAYGEVTESNLDETAPLATLEDPTVEEITGETYGGLKVLCEQAVQDVYGNRGLIVRPGLIVGPNDPSDRFTYWPVRFARGGEVLVPDRLSQPTQLIDVRDLASWTVSLVENKASGAYNGTGPQKPYTLDEVFTSCEQAAGTAARRVLAPGSFLEEKEVQPWSDLPLVLGYDGAGDGMSEINVDKAVASGLTFRSLEETAGDTLAWAQTRPADHAWRAGLTPEREAELIAELQSAGVA
jgi:2'-hydroxyisoflavone reductase